MNADWAPDGRQPSDQTNQFGLWVRWSAAVIRRHHRHLLLLFNVMTSSGWWLTIGTSQTTLRHRNVNLLQHQQTVTSFIKFTDVYSWHRPPTVISAATALCRYIWASHAIRCDASHHVTCNHCTTSQKVQFWYADRSSDRVHTLKIAGSRPRSQEQTCIYEWSGFERHAIVFTMAAEHNENSKWQTLLLLLRWAQLVLRWLTVSGFNSWCRTFISVCNQPPRPTQPTIPS